MPFYNRAHNNHLYTVLHSPRGFHRMGDLGIQIAHQYLDPWDKVIGVVGEAGSGKSMIIKGMFPGLELTNDDDGVNIRPLPILNVSEDATGFYSAHTYHLDIRFEAAFTQMHALADAINEAVELGKRVIVEHFDLIFPFLGRNADLLIGVGEEIIITRPTLFGPEPQDVADVVFKSLPYRRMTHSAEDICMHLMMEQGFTDRYSHADVRHGFVLVFPTKPVLDLDKLERDANKMIEDDVPISFLDDQHILIGDIPHRCEGPRMHVKSAGEIKKLTLNKEFLVDPSSGQFMLVGIVGNSGERRISHLNNIG